MKALLLEQENQALKASIKSIDDTLLPSDDVTVDIYWSTLNYKDALAITGKGKIIRQFPMVPGIDFAGIIKSSTDAKFQVGQQVLQTGWGVGENHWGGLAEQARVPAKWLTAIPDKMTMRQAMIIGTAGFTAMLCIMALEENGVTIDKGNIVVTGASGGVGSTAIQLLDKLGYSVTAVTGRESNIDYLKALGAKQVLLRKEFTTMPHPLEKQRWAGAIDTVGGNILATVISQMCYSGTIAACGLAADIMLSTTVMPFILRNVRLQGIDSVMVPTIKRPQIWQRLANLLPDSFYQLTTTEIPLEKVIDYADKLINNQITGRTLVKIR